MTAVPPPVDDARRSELAAGLAAARAAVGDAARSAGRDPADVQIVAVTKRWSAADVVALAELGIGHVGENRLQEAAAKRVEVAQVAEVAVEGLVWHFIGQLQTNKAKAVAAFIDQVDTVDRPALVTALARGAAGHGRTVGVLLQVSLADDPHAERHRGGCPPDEVPDLADAVAACDHLDLRGVMGMAPLGGDPARAFAILADAAQVVQGGHPSARQISAGMSADFGFAIAAGATHVRLGTAILGERPVVG